jgi:hypothetical protein
MNSTYGTLTAPAAPDPTSVVQSMVNMFGTAGPWVLTIIGAAVLLGIAIVLAAFMWRQVKKWIHRANS